MNTRNILLVFSYFLCLVSCNQAMPNIPPKENEAIIFYKLEDDLFLKVDKDSDNYSLTKTYDKDYKLIFKNKVDFFSLDGLHEFMLDQNKKANCNDMFYLFTPQESVDTTIPEAKKLGDFAFYYDEIKKIGDEEIYINPIGYYSFHFAGQYDGDIEDYTITGFFLPTNEENYDLNTVIEKKNGICNAITKLNGRILSSIFYSDTFFSEDNIKAMIKGFSYYTNQDSVSNYIEKINMLYGLTRNKKHVALNSEEEIIEKIKNKTGKKSCYFSGLDDYRTENAFYFDDNDSRYENAILKQTLTFINDESISISDPIEKNIYCINMNSKIRAINSWFFIDESNENVTYTINRLYATSTEVSFFKGNKLVGVAIFNTYTQIFDFKAIEEFINTNLKSF